MSSESLKDLGLVEVLLEVLEGEEVAVLALSTAEQMLI